MMKKYVRYAMLGLAIFALALLAGCGSGTTGKGTPDGSSSASVQSESAPQAASSSSSSAEKKAQKLTIKVYYPDEQGMKLIADKRTVTLDQQEKYTAALGGHDGEGPDEHHPEADEAPQRQGRERHGDGRLHG